MFFKIATAVVFSPMILVFGYVAYSILEGLVSGFEFWGTYSFLGWFVAFGAFIVFLAMLKVMCKGIFDLESLREPEEAREARLKVKYEGKMRYNGVYTYIPQEAYYQKKNPFLHKSDKMKF